MSGRCLSCLREVEPPSERHPRCARALFGTAREPALDLDLAKLHTYGLAMVGRTSISGAQRKVSLSLSTDRATFRVAVEGSQYLLKPQASAFPALPENEHVTTLLARAAGLDAPPSGLVRLRDGTLAYLSARFDRRDGRKLAMEDFCQLAAKSPKEKYDGSAELAVRIVRRFATEPGVETARLFRHLVFAWWTGNGDLHLKNLSLLTDGGVHRLSPAYDLLSTRLVIADDPMALPVGGKRDRITRATWDALAQYAHLPSRAADRILREIASGVEDACALVGTSLLGAEMRAEYAALLRERAAALRG